MPTWRAKSDSFLRREDLWGKRHDRRQQCRAASIADAHAAGAVRWGLVMVVRVDGGHAVWGQDLHEGQGASHDASRSSWFAHHADLRRLWCPRSTRHARGGEPVAVWYPHRPPLV